MSEWLFWPFWYGGAAVAAVAVAYPLVSCRPLGVSSLYDRVPFFRRPEPATQPAAVGSLDELEAALLAETEAEFGRLPPAMANEADVPREREFRAGLGALTSARPDATPFLLGILLGGVVAGIGRPSLPLSLGSAFDDRFRGMPTWALISILFVSGVLVGFGTRMCGGCPSGHGISGLAMGERGSVLATVVFWACAAATAWTFHWGAR